jgi:hypothetical protein
LRTWVFALTLAFTLVACTGSGGDASDPSRDAPSPKDAIAAFDQEQDALARSIATLNEAAVADPDAMRAAAIDGLEASDPAERFAAVYALALTASTSDPASIDALRELMTSPDATERLFAAGTLAALGRKDGVSVLIDALASRDPIRNVDPPMDAWRYARANLLSLVAQDLGLRDAITPRAAEVAEAAWREWWTANADALTWDAELGRYRGAA